LEFSGISVIIGSYTTVTNGSSTFNFSAIPTGSHTLWADTTGAGFASQTVYIAGGEQDLGTFTLLAADTDDSGQVNLIDFHKFRQSYGSPTPEAEADFNKDSACDLVDFNILRSNFGKVRSLVISEAIGNPVLYVSPSIQTVRPGEEVVAEVRIADISQLIGVALVIGFNSDLLSLVSVDKGGFLNGFSVLKDIRKDGRIEYDAGLLVGVAAGSGTFLSLKFLAKKEGTAAIVTSESKLMDSGGKWIIFGSQSACVKIEETQTQASLWIENMEVFKEETFTSGVSINVANLIGARVIVKYPGNLSLIDVWQGEFQTTVFLTATSTDRVEVVLAKVDGVISGSGSLFSLRFLAKETGSGTITFELADLRDQNNSQISVSTQEAEIFVKKRLLCDFNQNNEIDFDDLLSLIGFWKKPNPIYDIGPASGKPPDLVSQPDGIVNFEDLMVFCLMWKWQKNRELRIANCELKSIWIEEEGDWVVVKYRGLAEALGGRYTL
ncbi:MAG: cohesin domain-containing protein, partial [Candidatus Desantisbacteria bacterium]